MHMSGWRLIHKNCGTSRIRPYYAPQNNLGALDKKRYQSVGGTHRTNLSDAIWLKTTWLSKGFRSLLELVNQVKQPDLRNRGRK
jgi:hypothetical protein